jgi:hypothetical protein
MAYFGQFTLQTQPVDGDTMADRIIFVNFVETAKYGPFTIRIQYGKYLCVR